MILKVSDVAFNYASTPILKNVHMELGTSEVLVIVGPNGAGKSTLIKCIDRILEPRQGSILLDGQEMKKMRRREIAKRMGYVPQSFSGSFPATVIDTVLMGRRSHLSWRSSESDIDKVLEVLRMLNIEQLGFRDFNQLSGGQQQKVLIARAIVQEADLLLLDEPTSNLDIMHQLEVLEILKKLVAEKGLSVIMAIHDLNLAARYADRVLMLSDGSIFAGGDPDVVLTAENIKNVYNVEAVIRNEIGKPYIVPIRAVLQ